MKNHKMSFQYVTSVSVLHYILYKLQYSLKSGGTKYHFIQVKVPQLQLVNLHRNRTEPYDQLYKFTFLYFIYISNMFQK
jgi:hypothetical protein